MKKILIYIALLSLVFVACDDENVMDEMDVGDLTEEEIFSDVNYTRGVLYDCYGRIRDVTGANSGGFSRLVNMNAAVALLDNATDDGAGNVGRIVPGIEKFTKATLTAGTNPVTNTHPWRWYYRAVRNANTYILKVDGSPLSVEEKKRTKAEALFLRAYYYQEMFRWFGPLVINEEPTDPFDKETTIREDTKTTVRWIEAQFQDLIDGENVLPHNTDYEASDFGRATKGAAMAYKARLLLYAASPLHAEESGVTWAEAAKAAREFIDYADQGYYALYVDAAEPSQSYKKLFNTRFNSELIFTHIRVNSNDLYNCFPAFNPWNVNKELATNGTQWLIDCYDMVDGTEPIDVNNYGPAPAYAPKINPESGYNDQTPYKNRDPRLKQSFMYDGCVWPKVNNNKNVKVDISTPNEWASGYFVIKYLDPSIDHRRNGNTSMNFPLMRYAEVMLNYAEAINEAENTHDAREKAVEQLNRIRDRAGITQPLNAADYDQSTLRNRIRKERRVELSFEEHRFFDIRRWKIAKTVMRLPATGISKNSAGVYKREVLDSRAYGDRMDLMPIPVSDVNNCPGVFQNPGY